MTIMIVLTIVIYHYLSIVMCENLTIAHFYRKLGLLGHLPISLSGKKYALNKMHALNKQAFKYHCNGTLSSKSIISLLVYVRIYLL